MMTVPDRAGDGPVKPDHFFWQNGDLSQTMQHINQSSPAALATAFELLTAPATFSDATGNPISLFRTLSVSQQICVILSLRANPSRFPENANRTLQQLIDTAAEIKETREDEAYISIVRTLIGSERPPTCPEFLYTNSPAFPWAPELCTPEEAKIKIKNAAEAMHQAAAAAVVSTEQQAMDVDHTNDNNKVDTSDNGIRLVQAQECIRTELSTFTSADTAAATSLSPACLAALDIVLNAAAAIGFSQPPALSLHSITSSTDPLEAAGLRNQLPDDVILLITTATVSPSSSYIRCTTVARTILLPAVLSLDAPPTQSLTAAAQHLGKSNPKALIEHCLIPFLQTSEKQNNSSSLSFVIRYQAEFILRSIKQGAIPHDLLYLLIDAVVQIAQYWNDHVFAIVQGVLDTRPAVPLPPTPTVTSLAAALLQIGLNSNFKGSIKLAKVLLTFVKGYGKQMNGDSIEQCRRAAQSIGTFMMKPTITALDALAAAV